MQRPQRADVLGAAQHVDVVDQQLDVARLAEQPGDQGDGAADGHEDGQLHEASVVAGAQNALQPCRAAT